MDSFDCSHPLETGMPVFPGDDPVQVTRIESVPEDGAARRRLVCSSHVGTHIDAPAHKLVDGATLDDFDVGDFVWRARRVDCTDAGARTRLTPSDLPADLREGAPDLDALVFDTGWARHWGSERYRDNPYLGPALAEWCATRNLSVGIDAFSPDPVPSAVPDRERVDEPDDQPAHAALCGAGCLIVENLRGLDRLPTHFELTVHPLRIRDGDGSPVRAVARVAG